MAVPSDRRGNECGLTLSFLTNRALGADGLLLSAGKAALLVQAVSSDVGSLRHISEWSCSSKGRKPQVKTSAEVGGGKQAGLMLGSTMLPSTCGISITRLLHPFPKSLSSQLRSSTVGMLDAHVQPHLPTPALGMVQAFQRHAQQRPGDPRATGSKNMISRSSGQRKQEKKNRTNHGLICTSW